jgi:hypothetical protein
MGKLSNCPATDREKRRESCALLSGAVAATLSRAVSGMVQTTSGSGGQHAQPIRTLCRRSPARRTAGATGCGPLSSVAESARGGRKRTPSTTSRVGFTAAEEDQSVSKAVPVTDSDSHANPEVQTHKRQLLTERWRAKKELFASVRALHLSGRSASAIVRETGVGRCRFSLLRFFLNFGASSLPVKSRKLFKRIGMGGSCQEVAKQVLQISVA